MRGFEQHDVIALSLGHSAAVGQLFSAEALEVIVDTYPTVERTRSGVQVVTIGRFHWVLLLAPTCWTLAPRTRSQLSCRRPPGGDHTCSECCNCPAFAPGDNCDSFCVSDEVMSSALRQVVLCVASDWSRVALGVTRTKADTATYVKVRIRFCDSKLGIVLCH